MVATRPEVRALPPEALVRRIYWRRWAAYAFDQGLDPEDTYQEVWLAILSPRRAPYDPRRGALSTWLYCVMRTTVGNAADRHRRGLKRWAVGEAPVEDWPLDELVEAVGVVQALVGVAPEVLDYRVECRLRALGLPHAPSREEVTDARKP